MAGRTCGADRAVRRPLQVGPVHPRPGQGCVDLLDRGPGRPRPPGAPSPRVQRPGLPSGARVSHPPGWRAKGLPPSRPDEGRRDSPLASPRSASAGKAGRRVTGRRRHAAASSPALTAGRGGRTRRVAAARRPSTSDGRGPQTTWAAARRDSRGPSRAPAPLGGRALRHWDGEPVRDVVVLGSTGSVGTQALDIVRANPDRFRVVGLTAGGSNPELFDAAGGRVRAGVLRTGRGRLDRGRRPGLRRRPQRASPARSACARPWLRSTPATRSHWPTRRA